MIENINPSARFVSANVSAKHFDCWANARSSSSMIIYLQSAASRQVLNRKSASSRRLIASGKTWASVGCRRQDGLTFTERRWTDCTHAGEKHKRLVVQCVCLCALFHLLVAIKSLQIQVFPLKLPTYTHTNIHADVTGGKHWMFQVYSRKMLKHKKRSIFQGKRLSSTTLSVFNDHSWKHSDYMLIL